MPRRRLAGLLLMAAMLQMLLAPAIYACVAHRSPTSACHETASAASAAPASGASRASVAAVTEGPPTASGQASHGTHHTQACCAATDACRGVFVPAQAAVLSTPVTRGPLAPMSPAVPSARRAAPDSPPPKL
jgi:hypothetical protein